LTRKPLLLTRGESPTRNVHLIPPKENLLPPEALDQRGEWAAPPAHAGRGEPTLTKRFLRAGNGTEGEPTLAR